MMPQVITIKKSAEEGIKEFCKVLLQSKKVAGVLALTRKNRSAYYSLVTDPAKMDETTPLAPVMPANAATLLSRLTWEEGPPQPIAAVVRPCEERAFIERIKLQQGTFKNLYIISMTCGGVFPLKLLAQGEIENNLPQYYASLNKAETVENIRDVCKGCVHFIPCNADFTIDMLGRNNDSECAMVVNTDRGEELIKGIEYSIEKRDTPLLRGHEDKKMKGLIEHREKVGEQFYGEYHFGEPGMAGLSSALYKCVGCHSCSRACPICYCNLCNFNSEQHDTRFSKFASQLRKSGSVRVPPDTMLFHIGRLNHVSISCVGCGMCEDVCPVNIPLGTLFSEISKALQSIFDYVSGKNPDEDIPVSTFEEEELTQVQ